MRRNFKDRVVLLYLRKKYTHTLSMPLLDLEHSTVCDVHDNYVNQQ